MPQASDTPGDDVYSGDSGTVPIEHSGGGTELVQRMRSHTGATADLLTSRQRKTFYHRVLAVAPHGSGGSWEMLASALTRVLKDT